MSNAAINFGTCWSTPNGQDLSMPSSMASGFQVVGEAILRRWSTSRGQLIDDPNYGFNVTDLVGSDLGPGDIQYAQQQLAAEAQKDERVLQAVVQLTLDVSGTLSLTSTITTSSGPFKLVMTVSQTGVQSLLVSS